MIPYELIGKISVVIIIGALLMVVMSLAYLAVAFVWFRVWGYIANLAWKDCDPTDGPYPPTWRRKVAIAAIAIEQLDKEYWDKAHEELLKND